MKIDAGLDTGDMLLKAETGIGHDETAVELGKRLAAMGAELLVETLAGLAAGTIVPEKQNGEEATYAPLLKKEDGRIDWSLPAAAIHNRVRGLQPWPGAFTSFRAQPAHIWKTRAPDATRGLGAGGRGPAGSVVSSRPLVVACGEGELEVVEVQLEGRKRMGAADFVNGQRVAVGEVFV
jgi:methionyl-tRNA formyltransferase